MSTDRIQLVNRFLPMFVMNYGQGRGKKKTNKKTKKEKTTKAITALKKKNFSKQGTLLFP